MKLIALDFIYYLYFALVDALITMINLFFILNMSYHDY